MQGADILLVMAEVSVAVAGFAGVVTAFGRGGVERITPVQAFRLLVLVESAVWVLVSSLFPFILYHLNISPETIWRLGSGLLLAGYVGSLSLNVRRQARLPASEKPGVSKGFQTGLYATSGVTILGLALNTAGLFEGYVFGVYLAAVTVTLGTAIGMFMRIISATKIGWLIEDAPAEEMATD